MNSTVSAILADQMTQAKAKGWEYLFTNPGTGTRYKDIKKGFKNVLRDAGIENFWFHDLRRSFATRAGSDPSVAIPALAATLGHNNWQTTMRYTYATDEAKRRVVDAQEGASRNWCELDSGLTRYARSQFGHNFKNVVLGLAVNY